MAVCSAVYCLCALVTSHVPHSDPVAVFVSVLFAGHIRLCWTSRIFQAREHDPDPCVDGICTWDSVLLSAPPTGMILLGCMEAVQPLLAVVGGWWLVVAHLTLIPHEPRRLPTGCSGKSCTL
jgi:hypothetical protein